MNNFLVGFILGFMAAGAVTFGWYHGMLKPQFDKLKSLAEDRLKAGVETLKGKL